MIGEMTGCFSSVAASASDILTSPVFVQVSPARSRGPAQSNTGRGYSTRQLANGWLQCSRLQQLLDSPLGVGPRLQPRHQSNPRVAVRGSGGVVARLRCA